MVSVLSLAARLCAALIVALVLALGMAAPAAAQGTLRGTVTDARDASTLPGANVFLEGTALGAATNVEGTYRIGNIPAGVYNVRVSFVGYEAKTVPVTIADGETATLDVALAPSAILGEVVVSGQLVGQAAAINQQLASNTIVNVVSEEKIKELPDANAAESIGRLPGVAVQRSGGEASQIVLRGLSGGFTSITVDGVKIAPTDAESRSVDLSTISQGSLAGIELFKALTPDKDADAIAGAVNLVTRRAPRQREVRVDVLGSYNELANDAGQYAANLRVGQRFFKDFLGVQVTGNIEQRNRSKEAYDVGYDTSLNEQTDYRIDGLDLQYTDEIRRRRGLGTILDVETPDGGFAKLSLLYNHTSRDYITYDRSYPLQDLVFYSARDREQTIDLFNGALTGENHLFGLNASWGLSLARSKSENPFDYELVFTEPSQTQNGQVVAGMALVPDSLRKGDPAQLIPYALNNYDQAFLYDAAYRTEKSRDTDLGAYLNLWRDYTIGTAIWGQVKVGGKYRDKSRSRDRSELFSPYYNSAFPQYVRLADGTVVPKDFSGTMFSDLATNKGEGKIVLASNFVAGRTEDLYGRFNLAPIINRDALRAWWALNENGYAPGQNRPEYFDNVEARGLYYDIAERVSAAYAMSTLDFGRRVTWIVGVRVEQENNDYAARYSPVELSSFPIPSGSVRDTSATHRETVWLPNTHLAIRPTDFLTLRLAAYRALARPDFNRRLPTSVARQTGFFYPGNSITLGNSTLEAAKAWNYEVNASFFGARLGLLSISAFYKDISDYFHTINGLRFTGTEVFETLGLDYENPFGTSPFTLTVPFNSKRATHVYGVELEHQTNLRFLPSPLSGFVIGYNGSIIRSTTYVPAVRIETSYIERPPFPPIPQVAYFFEENKQKLQQQPDFLANLSLGYDFRAFSARVSMFHQDRYFTRFSADGRNDGIRGAFTRWDLAFKQNVGRRLALLLNVNNLTGVEEQALSYNSQLDRTLLGDSQIYGTTVDFGLRLDL